MEKIDVQKRFIEMRVTENRSLKSIADELKIPVELAKEWELINIDEISSQRNIIYDTILQKYELTQIHQFEYLTALYQKLRNELENRDFSGLPTDKLLSSMETLREKINQMQRINAFQDDDDFFDEMFDDEGYDPEDEGDEYF